MKELQDDALRNPETWVLRVRQVNVPGLRWHGYDSVLDQRLGELHLCAGVRAHDSSLMKSGTSQGSKAMQDEAYLVYLCTSLCLLPLAALHLSTFPRPCPHFRHDKPCYLTAGAQRSK